MTRHLFLRTDISGDGFVTLREFKRTLFGIETVDYEEDDNAFLTSIIEELQILMLKRDTNIDELFKTSRVNDFINQQEFLNKLNSIGYNLAVNKLKVDALLERIK